MKGFPEGSNLHLKPVQEFIVKPKLGTEANENAVDNLPKFFLEVYERSKAEEGVSQDKINFYKSDLRDWAREDLLAYVCRPESVQGLTNDPNLTIAFFQVLTEAT